MQLINDVFNGICLIIYEFALYEPIIFDPIYRK